MRATVHRAEFIDKLVMQLIQEKITQNFQKPESPGDYEKILAKFKKIEELHSERLTLLTKMHYSSYKREQILKQLRDIRDEIDFLQEEISSLFKTNPEENPLTYPLFETSPDDVNELDLTYRRELVKMLIRRVRFFNEYLILRINPITKEDEEKSDEMGRIYHINMRAIDRGEGIDLPDKEEIEESARKMQQAGPEIEEEEPGEEEEEYSEDDIEYIDED